MKNAFDLNRDVLKILEDQIKEKDPKTHIFYQIISRLTGINNQVMISNMEILTEKNKILTEVLMWICRKKNYRLLWSNSTKKINN